MQVTSRKISELRKYEKNAKQHPQWQIEQIKKSIQEFGFNDPIAVDEKGVLIEGHGRLEAMQQLGHEEIKCITLSHMTTQQKKAYILAHNKINMNTGFDVETLKAEMEEITDYNLEDFGFTDFEIDDILEEEEKEEKNNELYTKKIKGPIYEPKNEKPEILELLDLTYYKELITKIELSNVSVEEKEFLKFAATRHIVFNYEKCADYYSHSGKETQEQMEDSALVIIDFEKALEKGFVKLGENLIEEFTRGGAEYE